MNWDDLKIFLAVAEAPSMRFAAKSLKVSHSTVSRRIESLERHLGARLFDRLPDGYKLTPTGEELMPLALEMDESIHRFGRAVAGRDATLSGQICVTMPDVMAPGLFMPFFTKFMNLHPEIQLKISDSIELFDLSKREADVALRFTNAPPEHLIGRKIANVFQATYATPEYIKSRRPDRPDTKARWIGWGTPDTSPSWIKDSIFPHVPVGGHFDNVMIQLEAARLGAGIAQFPCFMGDAAPELVRLTEPKPSLELWVLSHRDLRATARVRVFRQYITDHTDELQAQLEGKTGQTVALKEVIGRSV